MITIKTLSTKPGAVQGAQVTAIDIWQDHHMPILCEATGLEIRYVQKDLFDLDPSFGQFDLVFCGSVLLHLWDQFTALRRLRSVCRKLAIVATDIMSPRRFPRDNRALAELIAARGESDAGEYWATWRLSAQALEKLLRAAGFEKVDYKGSFTLDKTPGHHSYKVLHGVFHAEVE